MLLSPWVNCSNCYCSPRDCSTLLAGNQLLGMYFEHCLNRISRIQADDKKITTARHCRAVVTQFIATVKVKVQFISYRAGFLNLLVPAYPQIKIVFLCVPPNQNYMPFATPKSKILPKRASFEHFFKFCVPPVTFSRTSRGTGIPGWEPLPSRWTIFISVSSTFLHLK